MSFRCYFSYSTSYSFYEMVTYYLLLTLPPLLSTVPSSVTTDLGRRTMSISACRFFLLIGRQGTILTRSPSCPLSSSSCAITRFCTFTYLLYFVISFLCRTRTTMLFVHFVETTVPTSACFLSLFSSYLFKMSAISVLYSVSMDVQNRWQVF